MFHKDYDEDRRISIDKWKCLTGVDHKLHQSSVSSYKKYINSIRYKLVVDQGKATLFVGAKCYHRQGEKKHSNGINGKYLRSLSFFYLFFCSFIRFINQNCNTIFCSFFLQQKIWLPTGRVRWRWQKVCRTF